MNIDLSIIKNSVNSIGNGLIVAGVVASAFYEIIPKLITITIGILGVTFVIVSALNKEIR